MTVKELIDILQGKPDHLHVVYRCCSEWCMLEADDIEIQSLCHPRPDGWVANARPDKEKMEFLTLPGN